jgi:DNA-binding MarR family transcriptional regulator
MAVAHHQYFDFLIAKSSQKNLAELDPASEKFLEIVALHNFKGSNLTMMGALALAKPLAISQSSLAKRIRLLQKLKLLEVFVDDADRRVKTLYPSMKTSSYFSTLSQQIAKVNAGRLR